MSTNQIAAKAVEQLYPNTALPPKSHALTIIQAAIEEALQQFRDEWVRAREQEHRDCLCGMGPPSKYET